jgi:GTP:adenosylcobinamide-phosphate guanylyltransferase
LSVSGFTALVLAGSRGGSDPVADYAGVAHKALIPIEGEAMILRVIAALRQAGAGRIAVSTDHPEVVVVATAAGVDCLAPAAQPSLSVLSAFQVLGAPLLVTTADHALLRPEWITQFLTDTPPDADLSLLLAERAEVEAAAPGTRRTYYRFARKAWSGCNLFYLATPKAAAALDLWRTVEAQRKHPWKVARLIGLTTLALYLGGRLTVQQAVARLGASVGVRAAVVQSCFGLSAVDVDKPSDLDLVREILAAQASASQA